MLYPPACDYVSPTTGVDVVPFGNLLLFTLKMQKAGFLSPPFEYCHRVEWQQLWMSNISLSKFELSPRSIFACLLWLFEL